MSDNILFKPRGRKKTIQLSQEERTLLNTILDLMIPADEHFPPPSSLHLLDELLPHLIPAISNHISFMLNEERLRTVLRDLNMAAEGNFCQLCPDQQKQLLNRFEQRYPVCFQALWTLVNHSYYSHLATKRSVSFA